MPLSDKENKSLSEVTSKGGKAIVRRFGKKYMQELGRKGGKATVKKLGTAGMSKLGKISQRKKKQQSET